MGTRHLIAVKANKKYRVAQYGQWDGYPEGQGMTVLNFLNSVNLSFFKNKVLNNTKFVTASYINKMWKSVGVTSEFANVSQSAKFEKMYPSLHRNTGANILSIINESNAVVPLENSIDFVKDGLFCEWAYVIDFDTNTFEVFKGVYDDRNPMFIKNKRFSRRKGTIEQVATWKLDDLPSKEEFLGFFGQKEAA